MRLCPIIYWLAKKDARGEEQDHVSCPDLTYAGPPPPLLQSERAEKLLSGFDLRRSTVVVLFWVGRNSRGSPLYSFAHYFGELGKII